jgi:hypothetical protein
MRGDSQLIRSPPGSQPAAEVGVEDPAELVLMMSPADELGYPHPVESGRLVDAIRVGEYQDRDARCPDGRGPEELIQLFIMPAAGPVNDDQTRAGLLEYRTALLDGPGDGHLGHSIFQILEMPAEDLEEPIVGRDGEECAVWHSDSLLLGRMLKVIRQVETSPVPVVDPADRCRRSRPVPG